MRPTIKQVCKALLSREDVLLKTRTKYVKKFKTIIEGCDDSNFIERFNDMDYIINVYLKNKAARTIETYIGEIMAIHYTIHLLKEENFIILSKYKETTKRANEKAIAEAKKIIEVNQEIIDDDTDSIEVNDTNSDVSSNDYGHYCIEEPEKTIDTLKQKKIDIMYEIENLEQRLLKLRNTLDILDEN